MLATHSRGVLVVDLQPAYASGISQGLMQETFEYLQALPEQSHVNAPAVNRFAV